MPDAPAEAPVARFRDCIAALIGAEGSSSSARFGVAVSGGPDSMALLWLATQAFPGRVEAATVDHGLRPEARGEADMVAAWCRAEDVPHVILTPAAPITGNIQSAAREARYMLLHGWRISQAIDWLLTAHHADDQLETMLMRLNRSSGVGGLAGVRARNGAVLRPLLGWRRRELMDVVDAYSLPCAQDPSNDDSRFDRVAMRGHLAGVDWLDPVAAARSASACADAEEALRWMVATLAEKYVRSSDEGQITLSRHDFPRELQRRLLLHILAMAEPGAPPPRGDTIDQAIVQLSHGNQASVGKWLLTGGESWNLRPAPPRKAQ